MSVSANLHNHLERLAEVDSRLLKAVLNITPEQIVEDPALKIEQLGSDRALQDLSIYQLHAKHKVNSELHHQLEELRDIKELHFELDVSLKDLKGAPSFNDTSVLEATIQRLLPTLNRMKLFESKILEVSNKNLAITFSLKEENNSFKSRFLEILSDILTFFVPEPTGTAFTLFGPSPANDSSVSLNTFYSICRDFEVYASVSDITTKLDAIRTTWEKDVLEPFISKKNFLALQYNDSALTISLTEIPAGSFLCEEYFKSLNDFVNFISATQIQSFKNYYSTKISNSLVDVISENIDAYMKNEASMNEELMHTLKLFNESGWKMPIRNVFVSSENIRANLNELYLNWTTNKYLEMARSLFNDASFSNDLQHPIAVEKEAQTFIEKRRTETFAENIPQKIAAPDLASEVSEELDWDQEWGSDTDGQTNSKRNSVASGKWSDKWEDDWDDPEFSDNDAKDDWKDETPKLQTISENKAPVLDSTPPIQGNPEIDSQVHTVTVLQTPNWQKISSILEEFDVVTNGADNRSLLDAIFSLALVSYPPVSELFLFLNDLRAVAATDDYLKNLATMEWSQFCHGLLNESVGLVSQVDFSNGELEDEDSDIDIQNVRDIVDKLFATQLMATNVIEFRALLVQLFDLINSLVIDIIIGSDEITEFQSEKLTKYLEGLQLIEANSLSQLREQPTILSTNDKIIQAKLLINNRLKSIMDYFYQGELFDFSTDELTTVIKAIFVPSELRENCLREIIDMRSA